MLSTMSGSGKRGRGARKPSKAKPPARKRVSGKASGTARARPSRAETGFQAAFAALLKARKLPVPKGLADAPPEAYASQPASFVEQLERLPDAELRRFAEQVAGYARRQEERAAAEWERSPLIAELRRRKLKEPPRPLRVVGVSVSLAKPIGDWSDKELLHAAGEWSRMGRS
jgi:hypothetical protein